MLYSHENIRIILSCNMGRVQLRYAMLVYLEYYFLCDHLSKIESWPVVGFCPHVTNTEVFGINLSTLYPNFGSFEGGVQHSEPAIEL